MILAGDDHYGTLLSVAEAQTQLSIWSIMASPLIMSSDLRTLKAEYKAVLLNNRAETARAFMSTKLSSLGLQIPAGAKYKVTDVWNAAEDKPVSGDGTLTTNEPVRPHGTALFRLTKE